jgi:hypothetical protein
VKPSTRLALYSLFRVGLFAAALTALMLLGLEMWLAAILGAIVAFCVSYIFFKEPRDAVARDLHHRRARGQSDIDNDVENDRLDRAEAGITIDRGSAT